jgi:hypothetical protein
MIGKGLRMGFGRDVARATDQAKLRSGDQVGGFADQIGGR